MIVITRSKGASPWRCDAKFNASSTKCGTLGEPRLRYSREEGVLSSAFEEGDGWLYWWFWNWIWCWRVQHRPRVQQEDTIELSEMRCQEDASFHSEKLLVVEVECESEELSLQPQLLRPTWNTNSGNRPTSPGSTIRSDGLCPERTDRWASWHTTIIE